MRLRRIGAGSLAAAVVATAALAAAARDGGAAPDARAGGSTTIDFLSVQQPTEGWPLVLGTLTRTYARTHRGVTFKPTNVPQAALNQRIALLSSQNALPTMYNVPPADTLEQMRRKGQVLDLGATMRRLGVANQLVPAAAAIIRKLYGGRLVALPLEFNIEGFWYNRKIFRENGLSVPTTWAQFVQVAAALQAKNIQPLAASGIQGWPITRIVGNYLFSSVGPNALENVKSGSAKMTDARYVAAAQAVAELGEKGYFGEGVASLDYGPAQDLFLQGKAAIFYMGSWALRDMNNAEVNKIGAANVGFFPFPRVGSSGAQVIPMNAGLPSAINPRKFTPEVAQWFKYFAKNYGDVAMSRLGMITGFKVHKQPARTPALTRSIAQRLANAKTPVLWFEARFNTKAQTFSERNAARLATGQISASEFMSGLQEALAG